MSKIEGAIPEARALDSVSRGEAFRNAIARADRWWILMLGTVGLIAILTIGWPDPFWRMLRFFGDGLWITISISVISFVLILVIGLLGGLGRVSPAALWRNLMSLYVEIVRGIPLLVQLLFIYYAFPQVLDAIGRTLIQINAGWSPLGDALINAQLSAYWSAVGGLAFCYGAYMTEIFRAGIQAIPYGQMEAALALGMTRRQAMANIILPQAVRVALPPMGNEFISLLKDSSLVSVVAVADLTRRGREFISTAFIPLEGWTMVALIYLVLTLSVSRGVAALERQSDAYKTKRLEEG